MAAQGKGLVTKFYDSLVNFVTGIGTAKDPTKAAEWHYGVLTQSDQDKIYRTNWIGRAIVDAPAEDSTREWRAWQASREQIALIEGLEKALNIREKTKKAIIKGRLYGGGALLLGVAQGRPFDELDLDAVGKGDLKFIIPLSRWELAAGPRIYDVTSPYFLRPAYYTVVTPMANVSGTATPPAASSLPPGTAPDPWQTQMDPETSWIHPSRVIEFMGNTLPDWRLSAFGGNWGDSVLQTCEDELRDAVMALASSATLLSDAKMDVIRIPDMSENMASDEYTTQLVKRFTLANAAKSTVNALILDSLEEWQRTQTNFAGIPPMLQYMVQVACGAGGVPMSRCMGSAPTSALSAKGSSGGEVDIQNYYDKCTSRQETEYRPAMVALDRCIIQSALGRPEPGITYRWNSLYKPDPKEKADTDLVKAQMVQVYATTALFNKDALRQAVSNMIIEDEVLPGWEDAVDKFGLEPEEPDLGTWGATIDPKTGKAIPALQAGAGVGGPQKQLPKPATKDSYDPDEDRDETGKWTAGGGGHGYRPGLKAHGAEWASERKNLWRKSAPSTVDSLMTGTEANQASLGAAAEEIAKSTGATLLNPGAKTQARIMDKLNRGKTPQEVNDAVRLGFDTPTPEHSDAVVRGLARKFEVADEGWTQNEAGYFDRKAMVRFKNGQIGEVQMWAPGMLEAKEGSGGGHKMYEAFQKETNPAKREVLVNNMKKLYGGVRDKLDPAWHSLFRPDVS